MLVAASTECFPDLPLPDALARLVDLEYTRVELDLHEDGQHLKPSQVAAELSRAVAICQDTMRLHVVAYSVDIKATDRAYYEQFAACCKLAKATKVVTITVPAGQFGTPFNEEVDRLRRLVRIADMEGVRVSMKSQCGRLSEDPDTVAVLCDNVDGLGLSFDPSPYICGPHSGKSVDRLMKYVHHVYLRDTSRDRFQVRVGQGEVEYGRLINRLNKVGYQRVLCVDIKPMEGVDHMGELRKMRLLLESLLI